MDKNAKIMPLWKDAAVAAFGFGIGGALWGLEAYRGTVGAGESFTNPFSYILGAVALAVFGGLALAYITQADGSPFWSGRFLFSKHALKIVGIGLIGWLVAFLLPAVWVEWMLIFGAIIQPIFMVASSLFETDLAFILNLKPSLVIFGLWVEFLSAGVVVGLVYSLILKTKILKTALWSAGGFALASLVGPILGNLIGNLFNIFLLNYILTFVTICVIFGVCLTVGIRGKQAKTSGAT